MVTVRKAQDRGHADHGWLDTRHTFSFANYNDPEHMGFRTLRVINEDRVKGGAGFGTHPHRDMEIISYVLEGGLEHRDSLGNGGVIHAGEFQRMSAGSGVTHSEYNASETEPVHFYQIWIRPDTHGIAPSFEQYAVPETEKDGRWHIVASREGNNGAGKIHQDATLFIGAVKDGQQLSHNLAEGRHAWVQVTKGRVSVNGVHASAGDGIAISDEGAVTLSGNGEVLLFDLG